jgi:predicted NBD/HSP70 family sugar kinase
MKEEQLAKVSPKPIANGQVAAKPPAAKPTAPGKQAPVKSITTLAVDVGGTGIKAAALDEKGKMITERQKIKTPDNATPKKVMAIIAELAEMSGAFDRVSVGFPGVIKDGVVYTAANLGKGWKDFPLEAELKEKLRRPVRIANDADVQGLGCVTGHGDARASDSSRARPSPVPRRQDLRRRTRQPRVSQEGQEEVEQVSARGD